MPGPANFNTPARILRAAMEDAGLLQDGDDPNSEQLARFMPRLNELINLWQTQGLKLWLNSLQTITLVAGTQVYTFGPAGTGSRLMRVLEGYYYDQNANSRPLIALSWNGWNMLSNKTQQGAVTSYFVDKQQDNTTVSFWLIPDTTAALGSVKLLVQTPITNLVQLNDSMNFPQEWFIALHWGLADEICTGQPDSIVQRCMMKAKLYRDMLEDWDVEDASTSFAPDTQQYASRFR